MPTRKKGFKIPDKPLTTERKNTKPNVWEIVSSVLSGAGPDGMTIAEMHRSYKAFMHDYYADQRAALGTRHYRVINGVKIYLKKPPRGMTYLSFARYVNRWYNLNLIFKTNEKGSFGDKVSDEVSQVLQKPAYYSLTPGIPTEAPRSKPIKPLPTRKVKTTKTTKAKVKPITKPKETVKPQKKTVKRRTTKRILTVEERRNLVEQFIEQMGRSPTQEEASTIFEEELSHQAGEW